MFKSQIIKIFRGYDSDKIGSGKIHEKESEEYERIRKELLDKIGDDKQIKALVIKMQNAFGSLAYYDLEDNFKEGFIFGARLALEICGVECDEEN